jgi:hypothetical protein
MLGLDFYDLEVPPAPLTKTDLRTRLVRVCNLCVECDQNPAKRLYCSDACRQAAYRRRGRNSADKKCQHCREALGARRQKFCSDDCRKAHHAALRLQHRNRWVAARLRDKAMTFDGRFAESDVRRSVPALGVFEKIKPFSITEAPEPILYQMLINSFQAEQ